MRKTATTILLALIAAASYAQNAYDAYLFSENNYEGTARSVAMGNAFTALGGDLGAFTINPASSAVAGYSQFSITPALTFSNNTTLGVSPWDDGSLPYFEKRMKSSRSRFTVPNMAMAFNWETGRKTGLKSVSFGFVLNKSASWDEDVYASGTNNTTSFMGQLAAEATEMGYLGADLGASDAFDFMPWKAVVGYQSGMISTYGGRDDQFVGSSELIFVNPDGSEDIAVGGILQQSYGRRVTGGKYEYVLNLGANISDFLYIGANLGVSSLNYDYNEYFKEVANDPDDFAIEFEDGSIVCFDNMRYNYTYSATGSGAYAKIGFILTPGSGLRIGGAIQTPTVTTVKERWKMSAYTTFDDNDFSDSASSPFGEGKYNLRSPMRANFGIAYSLGSLAVISADYEMCDYSGMKFDGRNIDRDYFHEVNEDIRNRYGIGHSFRAGIEVKPLSTLAIRAGYNTTSSAEKYDYYNNSLDATYVQNISFGLGYNSKKSFYADIAARCTIRPDEYFMPYGDYIFDENGNITAPTPEILNHQSLWKVLMTFGWRF